MENKFLNLARSDFCFYCARFRDLAGSRRRRKEGAIPKWLVVIFWNVGLLYACQLLWDFISKKR